MPTFPPQLAKPSLHSYTTNLQPTCPPIFTVIIALSTVMSTKFATYPPSRSSASSSKLVRMLKRISHKSK